MNVTAKQQLLDMVHGKQKSKEEIQQEIDTRNLQHLCQLHKVVGERIAKVEQAHEEQQSENLHRIAVGMLDIDLHKEMRCVEEMIQQKQKQHDVLYSTYAQLEKRARFKEERKRCLVEKLGANDAELLMNAMENNQYEKEKGQQREELQKKLSLI